MGDNKEKKVTVKITIKKNEIGFGTAVCRAWYPNRSKGASPRVPVPELKHANISIQRPELGTIDKPSPTKKD